MLCPPLHVNHRDATGTPPRSGRMPMLAARAVSLPGVDALEHLGHAVLRHFGVETGLPAQPVLGAQAGHLPKARVIGDHHVAQPPRL